MRGGKRAVKSARERGYEQVFASDTVPGRAAESYANVIGRIFPASAARRTDEIIAVLLTER
jgi:hypothetical protein